MPIDLGLINGDVWSAEHVNAVEAAINDNETAIGDIADDVARCGAFVTRDVNQSMPDGAITLVSWDTEVFDTDGFITVTDDELVVPADCGGVYAIEAVLSGPVGWAGASDIRGYLGTWDGATLIEARVNSAAFGVTTAPPIAGLFDLVPGDRIVAAVENNSGGAENFTGVLRMVRVSL